MRKEIIIMFALLMLTPLIMADPTVEYNETVILKTGNSIEVPLNVTCSGKTTEFVFWSNDIDGINITYSPNPLITKENTNVIMTINTSVLLAPERYELCVYWTWETESDSGNGKPIYMNTGWERPDPEEPGEPEEPVIIDAPDPIDNSNTSDITIGIDDLPFEGISNVWGMLGVIITLLFVMFLIIWRKKNKHEDEKEDKTKTEKEK